MNKKSNWTILLMSSAFILAVLPWIGFAVELQVEWVHGLLKQIYSIGWLWWFTLLFIDIVGLILATREKQKILIAIGTFLILFILVAGFIWLSLLSLLAHPPA